MNELTNNNTQTHPDTPVQCIHADTYMTIIIHEQMTNEMYKTVANRGVILPELKSEFASFILDLFIIFVLVV